VRIPNGYTSGNACLVANDVIKYIFELEDEDVLLTGVASSTTSETTND
jgi:penicillin-binding protein 2